MGGSVETRVGSAAAAESFECGKVQVPRRISFRGFAELGLASIIRT